MIYLAAESLSPGNGGICRVARLMARVIGEEVEAGRLGAAGLVLSDAERPKDVSFPVALAGRSRPRFAWEACKAALRCTHFIYDFEGMARAHCRLPLLRRPFMTWIHGIEVWENTQPKRVRTARQADFLLCNSAYTRERADRLHGGFAHAKVCWLATEDDQAPADIAKHDGPPTVLIVGRIDQGRYKGHEGLIECWPKVASVVRGARLVMVGRGPGLEALKQRAAASPVAAQIDLKGFVPDELMDSVWGQADVFAMPSRGEGFGLVYIEAMRHGLPVIASVHDAAPEVNLEGQTGYNIDLDKPDELPDRLICLLKDRDKSVALGANGQRRWQEQFRYSAFRQRFLVLLNEFLSGRY